MKCTPEGKVRQSILCHKKGALFDSPSIINIITPVVVISKGVRLEWRLLKINVLVIDEV